MNNIDFNKASVVAAIAGAILTGIGSFLKAAAIAKTGN